METGRLLWRMCFARNNNNALPVPCDVSYLLSLLGVLEFRRLGGFL